MIILSYILLLFSPVERILNSSQTTIQVISILKTFQGEKYNSFFDYVPNINPLNPTKMNRFSSAFGERFHPIDKVNKKHYGLDISAPINVPVHVAANGVVTFVGQDDGYGKYIIVKHKYGFETKYAHLNQILTRKNAVVSKGEIIGRVGNSGKSTGAHLHYEIIKNKKYIDPFPLVNL